MYVCYFELLFPSYPPADLQLDYSLTDDFCRHHFLVGLLMREVGAALQEFREVRHIAVQVLKGLMIKHTFDDRYAAKVSGIPEEDELGELGGEGGGRHFETFNYSVKYETFQSQQARLATLYLPLFGLLQENVHRLNVKDSGHVVNHSVSLTPGGRSERTAAFIYGFFLLKAFTLVSFFILDTLFF